jgi:hypothetical protein
MKNIIKTLTIFVNLCKGRIAIDSSHINIEQIGHN